MPANINMENPLNSFSFDLAISPIKGNKKTENGENDETSILADVSNSSICQCSICGKNFEDIGLIHDCPHVVCDDCKNKHENDYPECKTNETQLSFSPSESFFQSFLQLSNDNSSVESVGFLKDSQLKKTCAGCHQFQSEVGTCEDCNGFLCDQCVHAHKFMHHFSGHRYAELSINDFSFNNHLNTDKTDFMDNNKLWNLFQYVPNFSSNNSASNDFAIYSQMYKQSEEKAKSILRLIEQKAPIFRMTYDVTLSKINENFTNFIALVEDYKRMLIKEAEFVYISKRSALVNCEDRAKEMLYICEELNDKYSKHINNCQERNKLQSIYDNKLKELSNFNFESHLNYIDDNKYVEILNKVFENLRYEMSCNFDALCNVERGKFINITNIQNRKYCNDLIVPLQNNLKDFIPSSNSVQNYNFLKEALQTKKSFGPFSPALIEDSPFVLDVDRSLKPKLLPIGVKPDMSKVFFESVPPPTLFSPMCRKKMSYNNKFGENGLMDGQFTEPSGIAATVNSIIVADTNSHRIQVFDVEGGFKFKFGECGKAKGQMLHPNRVTINTSTGDIILTERAPTHQVQVYNQYGQFVTKFGGNYLKFPRAVAVDNKGRIIVVECKVKRVTIFTQNGESSKSFPIESITFPNGVAVNKEEEIFISDNREHCVKVFTYCGKFIRKIGDSSITNFPIGVEIDHSGNVIVADNHNFFNLTIFTQSGSLISALQSKQRHSECYDFTIINTKTVALATKDPRIYIYSY